MGLEPESPEDASCSEEDECFAERPTEQEVLAAGRVIAAWGRKRKARRKFLKLVQQIDESGLGSTKDVLKAHLSNGKVPPPPLVIVPQVLPAVVAEAALVVLRSLP